MQIEHYFVHGVVENAKSDKPTLPEFLAAHTGLYGESSGADLIVIWLNSPGGDLSVALEATNLINRSPIPVLTIINGKAESAALMIAMSGHRRAVFENSWAMAHHFSTGMSGNYHDLTGSLANFDALHDIMLGMYKKYTKMSTKRILDTYLGRNDFWLTAEALKAQGMVDEILKDRDDLDNFIRGESVSGKQKKKKTTIKAV